MVVMLALAGFDVFPQRNLVGYEVGVVDPTVVCRMIEVLAPFWPRWSRFLVPALLANTVSLVWGRRCLYLALLLFLAADASCPLVFSVAIGLSSFVLLPLARIFGPCGLPVGIPPLLVITMARRL